MDLKTKYVILDHDLGVFLGSYTSDFFEDKEVIQSSDGDIPKMYGLFASNNPFAITRAFAFNSVKEADKYIGQFFPKETALHLHIVPVKTSQNEYVDLAELCKSGLAEYTYDMLDGMIDETLETMH